MTLRLILTRHAKSTWDDPLLADKDRPLNKRGRASAKAVGKWLARGGYGPQEVLCSSAVRTRETWAKISDKLLHPPKAAYLDALYLAEPDQMLAALQRAQSDVVMMIAHNPGSAYMAQGLVATPPDHGRFQHYPTCATTVIDFPVSDWSDVGWGKGQAVDFVVPRDLI
ncbi:histidine phosphatase family protein [Aliiroseovarius subalbicans]|uniref:SixA phosphatase family protein n=1 Tax=Aliiroseovarius subalbicans TaxID=2925840 RepID=UPI001F57A0D5|nr:histidine phosphatase family protein [Aliiroseovarius subalbicans]MCI2401104.1 histidine phosphatase family protein [Aliiroseovarius subalbicans]